MVSVEEEAVLLAEAAQVVVFSNISTSGFNMPLVFSVLYDTVVYRTFALAACSEWDNKYEHHILAA